MNDRETPPSRDVLGAELYEVVTGMIADGLLERVGDRTRITERGERTYIESGIEAIEEGVFDCPNGPRCPCQLDDPRITTYGVVAADSDLATRAVLTVLDRCGDDCFLHDPIRHAAGDGFDAHWAIAAYHSDDCPERDDPTISEGR